MPPPRTFPISKLLRENSGDSLKQCSARGIITGVCLLRNFAVTTKLKSNAQRRVWQTKNKHSLYAHIFVIQVHEKSHWSGGYKPLRSKLLSRCIFSFNAHFWEYDFCPWEIQRIVRTSEQTNERSFYARVLCDSLVAPLVAIDRLRWSYKKSSQTNKLFTWLWQREYVTVSMPSNKALVSNFARRFSSVV